MNDWNSMLKIEFSQILLGDKNATYLCSKIISTLHTLYNMKKWFKIAGFLFEIFSKN